jgi:hypothetical protein
VAATIVALAALLALVAWFFWPARESAGGRPSRPRPGVDEDEVERAEREVQEASDEEHVRDWGPGAAPPPPAPPRR